MPDHRRALLGPEAVVPADVAAGRQRLGAHLARCVLAVHAFLGLPLERRHFFGAEKRLLRQILRTFQGGDGGVVPDRLDVRVAPRRTGRRPSCVRCLGLCLCLARRRSQGDECQHGHERCRQLDDSLGHLNLLAGPAPAVAAAGIRLLSRDASPAAAGLRPPNGDPLHATVGRLPRDSVRGPTAIDRRIAAGPTFLRVTTDPRWPAASSGARAGHHVQHPVVALVARELEHRQGLARIRQGARPGSRPGLRVVDGERVVERVRTGAG